MTDWISPEQFPDLLRPGMRVFISGASNEPASLVSALVKRPEKAAGVTFVQFSFPGLNRTDFTALHPQSRQQGFFVTPDLRTAWDSGRFDFIPMQYRRLHDFLATGAAFDLAVIQLSANGDQFRHGPNVDFVDAAVHNCRAVVAEVNRSLPAWTATPGLAADQVDWAVATDRPVQPHPVPATNAESEAIGAHVASLIHDGDCIQTGIGAIPCAVLRALAQHRDLGLHSGLLDQPCLDLIEAGVLTGRRKPTDQGQHIACMALGDSAFLARLGRRQDVRLMPASHTHEVSIITALDHFVSINSALEVDLTGQVNAEMAGGRQISGTGGAVDFMRGAAAAAHGRSIIAMPATAQRGSRSRIVPELPAGTAVTALRTDVDYVVTEYGIAALWGRSLAARREALIEVAAPAFRKTLRGAD